MLIDRKHYVGEIGTEVIIDCGQDITAATNTSIAVLKPDGTTTSWTPANIYTISGATRYLRYVTVAGDFDQAGIYEAQASLTLGSWTGLGETTSFVIYDTFS
jgi:hypothetical protein